MKMQKFVIFVKKKMKINMLKVNTYHKVGTYHKVWSHCHYTEE